jgi:pSer/pThr/pTyr-binding forkhead associated (FHA) protein
MSSTLRLLRHGAPPLELAARVLVGRETGCDVILDDKSVSRRHAYIEPRGASWFVLDQGSANGTFINGTQIAEAELRHGHELRLGTVSLWVDLGQVEEAPQTMLMGGEPATQLMPSPGSAAPAPAWGAAQGYSHPAPPAYAPTPDYGGGYGGGYGAPAPAPSPQSDAAALLGVHPGASAHDVAARYRDVVGDLEAKLSHAPNAHLRSTYQRNLDEARRAYEALVGSPPPGASGASAAPGAGASAAHADLPSAQPSLVEEAVESAIMDSPLGPAPVRQAVSDRVGGPSSITTGVGIALVGMLGLTTYFCLGTGKMTKETLTLEKSSDVVQTRTSYATYRVIDDLEQGGALKNGKLSLCNKASQPVKLEWLGATYLVRPTDPALAAQGPQIKDYNSIRCRNEFNVVVPPGAQQPVTFKSDNDKCRWDGETLYYGFWVKRPAPPPPPPDPSARPGRKKDAPPAPAEETVYYSGLLYNRTECVTIGEGW